RRRGAQTPARLLSEQGDSRRARPGGHPTMVTGVRHTAPCGPLRSLVPSLLRSLAPSFLRSFAPSFLVSLAPSFLSEPSEMCVLEPRRVFQAVAQHAVEADVREPDERE